MLTILTFSGEALTAAAPAVTAAVAEATANAMSQSEVIESSLLLMGQGMGGIFVVMAAISGIVWAITKFSAKK